MPKSLRIVFDGKQQVRLEPFAAGSPGPGEVLVRNQRSLMSTGTENIVFNRLFDPGTHWDRWVQYPFYPGYASTGVVSAVGEGVTSLNPGDRVAHRSGHRSHAVVPAGGCYPIPDAVEDDDAVWFALAKITFNGALAAQYRLGDDVAILGAGPIGQMSMRWARANGARRLVVIDPAAQRKAFAEAGGATAFVACSASESASAIDDVLEGGKPRVIVDSTGHAAVFEAALRLVADGGTVLIIGDTGSPASQTLSSDVMMRGLTITAAHDSRKFPGWDDQSIIALYYRLVAEGRISVKDTITHRFAPADCAEAYATANRERAATMGIVFDWRK